MRLINLFAGLVLIAIVTGCVQHAADVTGQLKPGMSESQVTGMLGQPMYKKLVRFKGHTEDYLVYEYEMIPDIPI
jgi:outer membrane protein assembly factor BamE (lipoprotein component of BamABCDE complex)